MISQNVNKFCCEEISLIENYKEAANSSEQWDCHHRKETDENLSRDELKQMNLYYDRPANELIFLTHADHTSLHFTGQEPWCTGLTKETDERVEKIASMKRGKPLSEEHRKKIGEKGKGRVFSEEHKRKIGEANSRRTLSAETKQKISNSLKGRPGSTKGKPCPKKGWHWKLVDGKRVYYQ